MIKNLRGIAERNIKVMKIVVKTEGTNVEKKNLGKYNRKRKYRNTFL